MGTRLRPFTHHVSKPLLPVMGVPVAQFAVDLLRAAGVTRVVANVHHLSRKSARGLANLELGETQLVISDESELLLGSAGCFPPALAHLGEGSFFVLNGDVICDVDLISLARRHHELKKAHGVRVTLVLHETGFQDVPYRRILFDPARERVTRLGTLEKGAPFYTGVAVVESAAVAHLEPGRPWDFIADVLEPCIERGEVGCQLWSGQWHDVGSPDVWFRAHREISRALRSNRLPEAWAKRLWSLNRELAPDQWVSSRCAAIQDQREWSGFSYWGSNDPAPERLGPDALVYDAATLQRGRNFSRVLTFAGETAVLSGV